MTDRSVQPSGEIPRIGTVVSPTFVRGREWPIAIVLGWGVVGVYVGLASRYLTWAVIAVIDFVRGDWPERAAGMVAERAEAST